eukprot:snap_masked-scaffold_1-processed-gene-28.11-mRNA-1 protein AED:1.00 eAED:1.00 QI:0/-1/0/0/-1/1/1/0/64
MNFEYLLVHTLNKIPAILIVQTFYATQLEEAIVLNIGDFRVKYSLTTVIPARSLILQKRLANGY